MSTSLYLNLPYRIKDINLCKSGKEEIEWIQHEMSGLMALREKYKTQSPLKGMRISGSVDINIYTAVFIETLQLLGAEIRWCSSNIYSTQDHAASYLAELGIPIFAWKNESQTDYWWAIFETLHFGPNIGPTHIIDEKGDVSLMISKGLEGEGNSSILDIPQETESEKELNLFLKRVLAEDQSCWQRLTKDIKAVTIDTQTANDQLKLLFEEKNYPIINLNSSIIKTKIDNYYSCKETIADAIKKTTRTILIGKSVLICGFGEIGRGCAKSLRINGASVMVAERDPLRAMQAAMQGYRVVVLEEVVHFVDIFITATGKKHVIKFEHMKQMKDQAIICNMGHYEQEIEYDKLHSDKEVKKIPISAQLNRYYFPSGNSILLVAESKLLNLTYETTQLAFIKSCAYSVQLLMQIELNKVNYDNKTHNVPSHIDAEVAKMHLDKIGAKLTTENE